MAGKLRIGVIFGGRSSEHEISLRSAQCIIGGLDPARYEIIAIGITREGRWAIYPHAASMLAAVTERRGELTLEGAREAVLIACPGNAHLLTLSAGARGGPTLASNDGMAERIGPDAIALDVIFPILHGPMGEDGSLQGLLELAALPYVGTGILGSAIGMDKDVQKRLLRDAGVPVVGFQAFSRGQWEQTPELLARAAAALGFPLFVKPNALGSSVGVHKVNAPGELKYALADAFQYDRRMLLEAACVGREFECAVLGNDEPKASLPGEVVVGAHHEFYSYESKYLDAAGAGYRIPVALPQTTMAAIEQYALAAFKALALRGMARVDFLAAPDLSQLYVNEVNTIPGFTSISMYPKLWEVSGLPLAGLLDRLIELALEEHRARAGLRVSYQALRGAA